MADKRLSELGVAKIAALADGNGIDGRQVKLLKAKEGNAKIHGQVVVEIQGKISTKRTPGDPPDGINLCATRHDWQTRAKTASEEAGKDPQLRDQLLNLVTERPGKGWGFETQKLKLPVSSMSFGFIETCDDCHGQGTLTCPQCRGEGWLNCRPCSARGRVPCTACNQTGQVDGAMGKVACNQCRSSGEMQCDQCVGRGQVQCRTCQGKQQIGCDNCNRNGRFTNVADVNLVGRAQFRMASKDIPPPMQKVFKSAPANVIDDQQAEISILDEKETKGGLTVNYRAEFPLAQIMVSLGKPKAKNSPKLTLTVFGHKGKLGAVPMFLDKLIDPGVKALEKAGAGKGNVASHIREATTFRAVKMAVIQSLSGSDNVGEYLLERFPYGLSHKLAKHIDDLLERAFLHITRRPRLQAVLFGCLITPLVSFGAYMLPIRQTLLQMTQNTMTGWAYDVVIPVICLAFTFMATRYVAARALKLSLPSLFNEAMEAAFERATSPDNETGAGMSGAVLLADQQADEEVDEEQKTKGRSGSLFLVPLIAIPALHVGAVVAAAYLGGQVVDWMPGFLDLARQYLPIDIPPMTNEVSTFTEVDNTGARPVGYAPLNQFNPD